MPTGSPIPFSYNFQLPSTRCVCVLLVVALYRYFILVPASSAPGGGGGFGGAEDGVACHVFSSNHQYPIGRHWADLCAMQYVWGSGSGTGCLHPSVSRATFPNSCDGTNLPFHRDWGPSITVLNIHDKFGTVRAYPEGAIRRLNQYSFGGLMHRGFFRTFPPIHGSNQ